MLLVAILVPYCLLAVLAARMYRQESELTEKRAEGAAPGYPGYDQVNFVVPDGVLPAPVVSVRLTYIGLPSNAVTIGVR